MRIPLVEIEQLDDQLKAMVVKWQAEDGDPNFIRTFGRLPETFKLRNQRKPGRVRGF